MQTTMLGQTTETRTTRGANSLQTTTTITLPGTILLLIITTRHRAAGMAITLKTRKHKEIGMATARRTSKSKEPGTTTPTTPVNLKMTGTLLGSNQHCNSALAQIAPSTAPTVPITARAHELPSPLPQKPKKSHPSTCPRQLQPTRAQRTKFNRGRDICIPTSARHRNISIALRSRMLGSCSSIEQKVSPPRLRFEDHNGNVRPVGGGGRARNVGM